VTHDGKVKVMRSAGEEPADLAFVSESFRSQADSAEGKKESAPPD
jgi:hypothetical protein